MAVEKIRASEKKYRRWWNILKEHLFSYKKKNAFSSRTSAKMIIFEEKTNFQGKKIFFLAEENKFFKKNHFVFEKVTHFVEKQTFRWKASIASHQNNAFRWKASPFLENTWNLHLKVRQSISTFSLRKFRFFNFHFPSSLWHQSFPKNTPKTVNFWAHNFHSFICAKNGI